MLGGVHGRGFCPLLFQNIDEEFLIGQMLEIALYGEVLLGLQVMFRRLFNFAENTAWLFLFRNMEFSLSRLCNICEASLSLYSKSLKI